MYKKQKIGIVIPAYNEEQFIVDTLKNLPSYIDEVIVIDDCSQDKTYQVAKKCKDHRVTIVKNKTNGGVGFSIKVGFMYLLEKSSVDIVCIAPGDNQCDTSYLHLMIDEVISGRCDYAKSNRFLDRKQLKAMPYHRFIGNIVFTLLLKFASGYYSVFDMLSSFSATKLTTIQKMDLDAIANRYDFEISYIIQHAILGSRVKDIGVPALYGEEKSDINYLTFTTKALYALICGLFRRINQRYVLFNFHPIALFFYSGVTFVSFGFLYGLWILIRSIGPLIPSTATVMISIVPFIVGIQLILQSIVLDIENEPK